MILVLADKTFSFFTCLCTLAHTNFYSSLFLLPRESELPKVYHIFRWDSSNFLSVLSIHIHSLLSANRSLGCHLPCIPSFWMLQHCNLLASQCSLTQNISACHFNPFPFQKVTLSMYHMGNFSSSVLLGSMFVSVSNNVL